MFAQRQLAWSLYIACIAVLLSPSTVLAQSGSRSGRNVNVVVADFRGPQAAEARSAVQRGVADVVQVYTHQQASRTARQLGVRLTTQSGRRAVARRLHAEFIVFGRVRGSGCDATTEIIVETTRGRQVAQESSAPPVGPDNRRQVRSDAADAMRAALAAAPPSEEPPPPVEEEEPPPVVVAEPPPPVVEEEPPPVVEEEPPPPIVEEEPPPVVVVAPPPPIVEEEPPPLVEEEPPPPVEEEPAVAEEEPPPEEEPVEEEEPIEDETRPIEQRSPTPVIRAYLGLGGGNRDQEFEMAAGGTNAYDLGFNPQLALRAEVRPFGRREPVNPRGVYFRFDYNVMLGLDSETTSGVTVPTDSYRLAVNGGYLYPFKHGQFGGLIGYNYDTLQFAANPVLPTTKLHELRYALFGQYDIIRGWLEANLEFGIGPVLGFGNLDDMGQDVSGWGMDIIAGLQGAFDFGLTYRGELRYTRYSFDFAGPPRAPFAAADSGTDTSVALLGMLGYQWGDEPVHDLHRDHPDAPDSSTPRLEAFVGLGGWKRNLQTSDGLNNPGPGYNLQMQPALSIRVESYPLGHDEDHKLRGIYTRFDMVMGLGVESEYMGTVYDTSAYQLGAHAGYLHPFTYGQVGGTIGYAFDRLDLSDVPAPPAPLTGSAFHQIRIAGAGQIDIVHQYLALRTEFGVSPIIATKYIQDSFGNTSGVGLDTFVTLEGATDFGLAYAGQVRWNFYSLTFDGAGATEGQDRDLGVFLELGYRWE